MATPEPTMGTVSCVVDPVEAQVGQIVTVRGRAEPGMEVAVYVGGMRIGVAQAGADGTWQFAVTFTTPGIQYVGCQAVDAPQDSLYARLAAYIVILPAPVAPTPPTTTPAPTMTPQPTVTPTATPTATATPTVTPTATPTPVPTLAPVTVTATEVSAAGDVVTVVGQAAPGTELIVTVAEQSYTTTAGEDGRWVVQLPQLPSGAYAVTARAVGASPASVSEITLVVATPTPAPTPTPPTPTPTAELTATATQTAIPTATPTVTSEPTATATEMPVSTATTSPTATATVSEEPTATATPTQPSCAVSILQVAIGDAFTVTGQGLPGSEIMVYIGSEAVGTAVADTAGNWQLAVTLRDPGIYYVGCSGLDASGALVAVRLAAYVVVQSATVTPTPSATHTTAPSPTATASATPTPSPAPTATATNTATPVPTATPEPTATATDTATPEPTATPAPSATHTTAPSPTATASATPTPSPTPTVTATNTATPEPTATPVATATTVVSVVAEVTATPANPGDLPRTGAGDERSMAIVLVIAALVALLVGYEQWERRTRVG